MVGCPAGREGACSSKFQDAKAILAASAAEQKEKETSINLARCVDDRQLLQAQLDAATQAPVHGPVSCTSALASTKQDLDKKELAGMSGAFLRVDFVGQGPYETMFNQMANPYGMPPMPPMPGVGAVPGFSGMSPMQGGSSSPGGAAGRPKKYTCKLEVGIENEGEFRVGSRVIQIARQIWQDPNFQQHGGKTRLRGKGIGGPHEADEPLALCI